MIAGPKQESSRFAMHEADIQSVESLLVKYATDAICLRQGYLVYVRRLI